MSCGKPCVHRDWHAKKVLNNIPTDNNNVFLYQRSNRADVPKLVHPVNTIRPSNIVFYIRKINAATADDAIKIIVRNIKQIVWANKFSTSVISPSFRLR